MNYVFWGVPLSLIFALLVAVLLNRNTRGISIYRAIYYVPSLFGGSVAIAILWRRIFGSRGLINGALAIIGVSGPSWISDPKYALSTLVILRIWQFGSPMVIFLAALKQVPKELYEAAEIDGAGSLRKFLTITLPLISSVFLYNLIMQIISAFQTFTPAYVVSRGSGGPVDSTLFYTLYLYEKGFSHFQMGYASAMAWVLVTIIASATALAFIVSKRFVYYEN
jgi:multiple sugar transport system permease protein